MVVFWKTLELFHVLLSWVLFPLRWSAWGTQRLAFERQIDSTKFTAAWAFEVSSEGEWEQVRPWVNALLSQNKKLEIIFSSPSVEKALVQLASQHPNSVRLLRLPLLAPRFGSLDAFVTAPRFVMCRYDFFPGLMALAARRTSGLVWASFKNRRHRLQWPWWRAWYRFFFAAFDWILPAVPQDEELFRRIHGQVLPASDLRAGQILARLDGASQVLASKIPCWPEFQAVLNRVPRERRWIIGSFWEHDLDFLRDDETRRQIQAGELLVIMVPHQLSEKWKAQLLATGVSVNEINASTTTLPATGGVWLLNLKGVLCELYTIAGNAYVGGGFGRSVHSVLEPFAGGANVCSGPRVHRSTEVELIQAVEPLAFKIVDRPQLVEFSKQDATYRAEWLRAQRSRGTELLKRVESL